MSALFALCIVKLRDSNRIFRPSNGLTLQHAEMVPYYFYTKIGKTQEVHSLPQLFKAAGISLKSKKQQGEKQRDEPHN
jgi:hypothetical protein